MAGSRPVVWVVGSLNVDLVVRVPAHPRVGETVLGGDVARFPGGKGANQAAAAALAAGTAATICMLGRHGHDAEAGLLRDALQTRGVDLSAVTAIDAPTGIALIAVDEAGRNTIVVSGGANRRLRAADVDGAFARQRAAMVLTQLETPLEVLAHLARWCASANVPLVLNAAPPASLPAEVWAALDTLIVNEHEAAALGAPLAGTPLVGLDRRRAALSAAAELARRGPRSVVVTLGGDGVAWAGASSGAAEAPPVHPVDTTGAGDAFCGAFVAGCALGMSTADAIAYGQAAGALAVTRAGAIPSLPDREAILGLLADRLGEGRPFTSSGSGP